MIRDLLEQANDIQTKLNLLEKAKQEMIKLVEGENITFSQGQQYFPGPGQPSSEPERCHIKNTRALRRLMELLK